jgi:hypothetical protein
LASFAPWTRGLFCLMFVAIRPPGTLRLLSCSLNRVGVDDLLRHRRLLSTTLNTTLSLSTTRRSAVGLRSSAPCSLPCSSTGCCGCSRAAFEPPGRNSPSDSRGIITGTPARSNCLAASKISCFPSSLVCTSPRPPKPLRLPVETVGSYQNSDLGWHGSRLVFEALGERPFHMAAEL